MRARASLGAFGESERILENLEESGRIWESLGESGRIWENLGELEKLGESGRSWENLGESARICENLGESARASSLRALRARNSVGKSWGRAGKELGESWARAGQELGKSWERAGGELGKSWGRAGEELGPTRNQIWTNLGQLWRAKLSILAEECTKTKNPPGLHHGGTIHPLPSLRLPPLSCLRLTIRNVQRVKALPVMTSLEEYTKTKNPFARGVHHKQKPVVA